MEGKKPITILIISLLLFGGAVLIIPGLIPSPSSPESNVPDDLPASDNSGGAAQSGEEINSQVEREENQDILPTPRQELVSTDPEMVDLTAGKIQFIELFAFW
jgi:hypothetical protein